MTTIEDCLQRNAKLWPHKTALIAGDAALTYGQLWQRIESLAGDMDVKGRIVPLQATPTTQTIVTYHAIHLAGGIAAPLDKNLPPILMEKYKQLSMRPVSNDEQQSPVADVLFTTGTTGEQKGVMVSHRAIMANAENLTEAQHYSHNLTFIINGPLNHIGSLSKLYPTFLCGGTVNIVYGMRNMASFFDAIDNAPGRAATFLVPATIRMILALARRRLEQSGSKIEFIETGAAPMSQSDMEALCQTLPNSRLYNTYASTETGIIATYNFNQGECIAGCLGQPMRHSGIAIDRDGLVTCSGETIMNGYLDDLDATKTVLKNGILRTNDIGTIDSQGRLRLQGRADDIFNIGGFKVNPAEVENVAMACPGVSDCVCIARPHLIVGSILQLLVVCNNDTGNIANYLSERLEPHEMPTSILQVDSIRRTFNGKIDRKAYRES